MVLTTSKLRENIYRFLDQVLKTGQPLEIERKGRRLKIVPVKPAGKLNNLPSRSIVSGSPESIVHIDWSKEWKPKIK
ncbi:MAG: type II toxin-antitoxin system Phd/YefM family antitoxin [Deltaproteobacteria bacterium]|nr:type II toxin-antitoxin system Phd/YefM family antitoxin [Deltaproteobacteria bacterium]